jgi:polar amino acid transport system substrate-binding protein
MDEVGGLGCASVRRPYIEQDHKAQGTEQPGEQLSAKAQLEGFEIDLAADIAKKLGVKLVTVNITTENRFQKLEQGDVDVLIATVGDTAERRQIATAIEPNY